jgi:hypothetical protein
MSSEEILKVGGKEIQEYLFDHAKDDEKKLLLKHKSLLGLPSSLIAQQIAGRKKIESKVPLFFQTKGVVYPLSINLEQSSSEATARLKANIILKEFEGKTPKVADITGGFGIDSFFFSEIADTVTYVEPDSALLEIVRHNFSIFKKGHIMFHCKTAQDFLKTNSVNQDFIFLDPSRRDSKTRKVFSLSDCSPDVTQLLRDILCQTTIVLLKASPLLDIKQGLRELDAVKRVIIVSVANDCKELLFLVDKRFSGEPTVETLNLNSEGSVKHAFEFKLSEEETSLSELGPPQQYLYEPNAAILKAGAFKLVGKKFDLKKIHVNTHLYTSSTLKMDFPGRVFEIEETKFDSKLLSEKKANIITRNHPHTPEELKKKFKLKDGGEKYVIAFSSREKKYTVLAKRLA